MKRGAEVSKTYRKVGWCVEAATKNPPMDETHVHRRVFLEFELLCPQLISDIPSDGSRCRSLERLFWHPLSFLLYGNQYNCCGMPVSS